MLDSGASVNVLPYSVGVELGYGWNRQTTALSLTGNLAQYEARVVLAQAIVGQFEPVQLVFAWTLSSRLSAAAALHRCIASIAIEIILDHLKAIQFEPICELMRYNARIVL